MKPRQPTALETLPTVLLVGTMLGTTLVVTRFSLADWQPLNFVGLRLSLAAVAFMPLYLLAPLNRPRRDTQFWLRSLVWALLGGAIPMSLTVASLNYQSSGVTSLLTSINPAVVALQAHFFLPDEPLTLRRGLGIGLAFAGTLSLVGGGNSGLLDVPLDWRGPALVLVAVLSASTALIFARRYMRHYHSLDLAMSRIVLAAPVVMVAAVVLEGAHLHPILTQRGALGLVYAGLVGTLGAMVVGIRILTRFGATYAVQPGYVQPVIAILGGAILLGEQLSPVLGIAISLVILGIWLINTGARH